MREVWKDISGYEGYYQVSNLGRVKSLDRYVPRKASHKNPKGVGFRVSEKILKPSLTESGHPFYVLWKEHASYQATAHKLVMECFVGPRPEGCEICHNDGDAANPTLSNLRYDTPKANNADKHKHGTHVCGERQGSSKLKASDVRTIRSLISNHTQEELADEYGVTQSHIHRIVFRKAWKHI